MVKTPCGWRPSWLCLSKPVEPVVETDEDAAELQESEMDIRPAFIANPQAAEAREPREGALDYPPVAAQLLAALDPAPSYAGDHPPLPTLGSTVRGIVAFVGVQFGRSPPWSAQGALDRRDRIEQGCQRERVGAVGRAPAERERDAPPVDQQMLLAAPL